MRVVFLNRYFHPDHSATSQMLSDLAFHLAGRGLNVQVITGCQLYDAPDARLGATAEIRGVSVRRVGTTRFGRQHLFGRALDYLSFYRGAAKALEETALPGDLVVAMTDPPMLGAFVAAAAARRGARLVNWLQDLFPEVAQRAGVRLLRGPLAGALKRRRDAAMRAAAMNVAVGAGMAEYAAVHCAVPRERLRVISNWADGEALKPVAREANPLRKEWGLQDKFVVGYSGNLGRVHEHDTILGAMRRLKERSDIAFLFIGAGSKLAQLKQSVQSERLDNALFKPYQDRCNLPHSLGVADVHLCVLRPEFEGLVVPSKFYGIAAAGRPAVFIGDPHGEIPQIMRESACGTAVNTGEPEKLAAMLADYEKDRARCEREGSNARRLLEIRYDSKIALASWENLLVELSERP